jgi:hypothetical protein
MLHAKTSKLGRNVGPMSWEGRVRNSSRVMVSILMLAAMCSGQDAIAVHSKGKQKWPAVEGERIYAAACAAVQREFGGLRAVRPHVTLVLGAEKNDVDMGDREIRLRQWDRNLFAQGVVLLAFQDLLPVEQRVAISKRAMSWVDATVEAGELAK